MNEILVLMLIAWIIFQIMAIVVDFTGVFIHKDVCSLFTEINTREDKKLVTLIILNIIFFIIAPLTYLVDFIFFLLKEEYREW